MYPVDFLLSYANVDLPSMNVRSLVDECTTCDANYSVQVKLQGSLAHTSYQCVADQDCDSSSII